MNTVRCWISIAWFLFPVLLSAQRPMGEPFPVNLETQGSQLGSRVAANASGEFVVTWTSNRLDSLDEALYARRFGADGSPTTGETLIASDHLAFLNSGLAMMDDGSFVVVFAEPEGAATVVRARRYTPDGALQDDVVLARGNVANLAVASRGDGGIALVWSSDGSAIRARAFGPDHAPLGPEVLVARLGGSPVVAVGPQGEFVVAFVGAYGGEPLDREDNRFHVAVRRFAADGTPLAKPLLVSRITEVSPFNIRIGKDGAGNFLVTWTGQFGTLGSGTFLRRYTADGAALSRVLRLPEFAGLLSVGRLGNFLLAWADHSLPGPSDVRMFVRRFAADGSPLGPAVQAVDDAPGDQHLSGGAILPGGGFVVTWYSDEGDPDRLLYDVFVRRFRRR